MDFKKAVPGRNREPCHQVRRRTTSAISSSALQCYDFPAALSGTSCASVSRLVDHGRGLTRVLCELMSELVVVFGVSQVSMMLASVVSHGLPGTTCHVPHAFFSQVGSEDGPQCPMSTRMSTWEPGLVWDNAGGSKKQLGEVLYNFKLAQKMGFIKTSSLVLIRTLYTGHLCPSPFFPTTSLLTGSYPSAPLLLPYRKHVKYSCVCFFFLLSCFPSLQTLPFAHCPHVRALTL